MLNSTLGRFQQCHAILRLIRLCLLLLSTVASLAFTADAQNDKDAHLLELHKPVERELAGGQSHSYPIALTAGQYLRVVAEQRGIDVVVTLFAPDGKQMAEVDSPNGSWGSEPLSAVAEAAGTYRLVVRSLEKEAAAGRYEVRVEELRAANDQDKIHIAAERAFTEAELLLAQGSAESVRGAVGKFEEALTLYRAAGDRNYEGMTLNRIGFIYEALGDKRKALDYHTQTLMLVRATGDREGEAAALNNIGFIYDSLGQKQKALDHFNQALALSRATGNRPGEAAALNNLGLLYDSTGDPQKALDHYGQALTAVRAVGDKSGEASTLNGIGKVYESLGDRQKALDYYGQALALDRANGNKRGEAKVLTNIGASYASVGDKQKALAHYLQALPLYHATGELGGEAKTLNNIGLTYAHLGEWQKALEYYEQSLPIYRTVGDRAGEATLLNNVAGAYYALGETRKALTYLEQVLPIYRAVGDRRGEGNTLANIGSTYNSLGESQKALDYYALALPIRRAVGDLDGEATTLNNIGRAHYSLGDKRKALNYYGQALSLRRAAGNRSGEAATLNNIGAIHASLGETQQALDHYAQSLPLSRSVSDHRGEATTLSNLVAIYRSLNKHRLAIFFGKQSVNVQQQLRSNIHGLENNLQKSYLKSVEPTYRALAELLIMQGRLSEAQQVLNAFKDQQYFDFDQTQARELTPLALTPREKEFAVRQGRAVETLGEVGLKVAELKRKTVGRQATEEESGQLQQLEAELATASGEFSELLKQAEAEFSKPADKRDKVGEVSDTAEMQAVLRQLKKDTGRTAVAVYTVAGEMEFHALIVTADGITSGSSAITGGELNRKARELWGLLQSDAYDPTVLSHDLYNVVFKPLEEKLPKETQTIMWSLDGNLRYVPMAALYDGRHYLVERYSHVNFTRADPGRLTHPPSQQWAGVGMGSSRGHTVELQGTRISFEPLPGVGEELRAVFRAAGRAGGVLEGEVLPDERFTRTSMLTALARRRPVVHIASHFIFRPGDEAQSFLLLGDGSVMTLAEMKSLRDLFAGVELLTLSACNTAAQQPNADGREIDAFAELAQRLGAGAVMATLWPVADDSSPWLMREFYQAHRLTQGVVKAEALRKAQVALLRGSARVNRLPKARREVIDSATVVVTTNDGKHRDGSTRADVIYIAEKDAPPYKRDERKPFAHPYYWAPFILIGNWR